jgi:hypothetical protein
MVHTPIEPNTPSERQEVINWLIAHNYPALPVAPAQPARKYYKVDPGNPDQGVWSHCPLTANLQPIPVYTGKNPSFLDAGGTPHLINHRTYQKRLPEPQKLKAWFAHPSNGVGTLGGWNNTVWLDFDVKQFPTQDECDAAVLKILERKELQETFIERSHSGGWRIGITIKQKPNFTNFSLTPGGAHVGEALFTGRFTVLAPTIGPSGNPYQSIQRAIPVEVESLESIGIYSTKHKKTGCTAGLGKAENQKSKIKNPKSKIQSPKSQSPLPGSIPLEMLGSDTSRNILQGNCPTGSSGSQPKVDRSEALTTAAREWYGWQNWALENGIPISGDATTLAYGAGTQLGLDSDRINRILKTIDSVTCQPAALYRGGEESCWKKVYRLDKATFDAKCPAHIKEAITAEWGHGSGNGSSGGGGRRSCSGSSFGDEDNSKDNENRACKTMVVKSLEQKSLSLFSIRNQIKDILIQDLPPSELSSAKIRIRADNPGLSEREISQLFETLEQELELSESRSDRRAEVDNLLKLGDQSLSLSEFLPADLAEPLTQLSEELNIRPEVCLTTLLVAASSLHKTQTELVIHRGQGFSVPPTIFAGLVSESGQKKSPILKALIKKPLSVLQKEKRQAFQEALAQYEKDITDWDRCKSEDRSSKFSDGKPRKPQQRLYYFTNATGEGILYQFQAHPDKALLALVDELAGLFASQNKYTGGRGSDRQDILSAFDGTGATVLRAAGTKADLDGILLSICGTIQPEVLKRLMKDCSDPDGQWARFLFVNQPLAAATLADDNGHGSDLTERLLNYYRAIDRLPAREYRLSREAFKRYQPIYNQLERLRVSHPSPGMRAVYSKMEGYIGRLALNLHILLELNSGKTLPAEEIPLQPMERAIALAKFYIGQVKLIHANCSADLGELAPHLVKVVELSKRMDSTTGCSWIKAKVVQSGYDSRHRPRPDAVRSWFRELEALGIGTTRGTGIRLEYSWKLPDLPLNDDDPPPLQKVEKVDKSGEKWITSPPPKPTQNQAFSEKVDKVDNPTHLLESGLTTLDCGLKDTDKKQSSAEPDEEAKNPQSPIPNPKVDESIDGEPSKTQSPEGDDRLQMTKNSLEITHSTSPQSCCDDGVATEAAVDTHSTFTPPVESVSNAADGEKPDERINKDEATQVTFIVFPLNQRQDPRDSDSAEAGVVTCCNMPIGWKVVLDTTALQQNLTTKQDANQDLVTVEEFKLSPDSSSCTSESVAVVTFIESASEHKDQGESTDTGTNALSLLALVMSAIQGYCSSQVERSSDLPNSPEGADEKATVESQATETGDKVDQFKEGDRPKALPCVAQDTALKAGVKRSYSVGDRVHWTNCPVCCGKFGPFEIMWIEGEYAKLDLFPDLVPLKELLRRD